MKHFIYLSDSKIDMLFAQIPRPFLSTLVAKIGVNIGVLQAELAETKTELNRYDKLKAVLAYLENEGKIGTLNEMQTFFRGSLEMKWGQYEQSGFLYFTGREDDTIVGLGGSLRHVLGNENVATLKRSSWGSSSYGVKRSLVDELEIEPLIKRVQDSSVDDATEDFSDLDWLVGRAYQLVDGPKVRVNFVALRLDEGIFEDKATILGTPLYVSYDLE